MKVSSRKSSFSVNKKIGFNTSIKILNPKNNFIKLLVMRVHKFSRYSNIINEIVYIILFYT